MFYPGVIYIIPLQRRRSVLTAGRDANNTFVLTVIGALAQLAEPLTLNQLVLGSDPRRPTTIQAFLTYSPKRTFLPGDICVLKWSTKLVTKLEFFQYRFSDSFGDNPPLYSCGLSAL